ncbi:MAG: hypothetical protein KBA31_15625 [Alphaproteobacteria bacterium]|nr:hypothetical protein [Alphaproteobacteria bacterium]
MSAPSPAGRCLAQLFLGLALLIAATVSVAAAPMAVNGVLDLSQHDFSRQPTLKLRGDWIFYPTHWASEVDKARGELLAVPKRWKAGEYKGYGTYVLRVVLPDMPRGERLMVNTGYIFSSYRLSANDQVIAESGTPAARADDEVPRVYSLLAPLPDGVRTVELKLEVSSHLRSWGGVFATPTLGLESAITADRNWLYALAVMLVGAMLFGAAYHFLVFALSRDAHPSFWFAVFSSVLALRTALIEPIAPHAISWLGQDWIWRIDFAATVLLLPTFYQFCYAAFPAFISRRLVMPLAVSCGIGAAASILFGSDTGSMAVRVMEYFLAPLALIVLTVGIVGAVRRGAPGAQIAMLGWIVCAAAVVHDILMDLQVIAGINLVTFGFIASLLCFSGMIAAQYRDRLRRTATDRDELEAAVANRTRELSDKIDELKVSQIALEQARREAVSANVAKSRFLATMSHELRTPLNSILGFSDIIRSETLGPVGDNRYKDYATHIHDSGTHLLNLIGDVLDISRIEAGRVELRPEPLDIRELCETALRHAATRERRGADVVTRAFEDGLPLVTADQRAVTQMVINLVSNAMKFTPGDGRIVLTARQRDDGGVSVEVADSGVGMDAVDIPKALAVFSQVDDSHARRHEGTGLGLPIVKSLIELHGGQLSLTSEKGKGTTVRLDFPASASVTSAVAA